MSDIQKGKSLFTDHRLFFPLFHVLVKAGRFVFFVVEVFDGLIVEQGIDTRSVRARFCCIHPDSELGAPHGNVVSEQPVSDDRDNRNDDDEGIKVDGQNDADQCNFEHCRDNRKYDVPEQGVDAPGTSFDISGYTAGFPPQMKFVRQSVKMIEYSKCDLSDRTLGGS